MFFFSIRQKVSDITSSLSIARVCITCSYPLIFFFNQSDNAPSFQLDDSLLLVRFPNPLAPGSDIQIHVSWGTWLVITYSCPLIFFFNQSDIAPSFSIRWLGIAFSCPLIFFFNQSDIAPSFQLDDSLLLACIHWYSFSIRVILLLLFN